jgi:hypothetical protein
VEFDVNRQLLIEGEALNVVFEEALDRVRTGAAKPLSVLVRGYEDLRAELTRLEKGANTIESRKRRLDLNKILHPPPYNADLKELLEQTVDTLFRLASQMGFASSNHFSNCLLATMNRLHHGVLATFSGTRFDVFIPKRRSCAAAFYLSQEEEDRLVRSQGIDIRYLTRLWGLDFWSFSEDIRIHAIVPTMVEKYLTLKYLGREEDLPPDDEYFDLGNWQLGLG